MVSNRYSLVDISQDISQDMSQRTLRRAATTETEASTRNPFHLGPFLTKTYWYIKQTYKGDILVVYCLYPALECMCPPWQLLSSWLWLLDNKHTGPGHLHDSSWNILTAPTPSWQLLTTLERLLHVSSWHLFIASHISCEHQLSSLNNC